MLQVLIHFVAKIKRLLAEVPLSFRTPYGLAVMQAANQL